MKFLLCLSSLFLCLTLSGQTDNPNESREKIVIDNDKLKVIEFTSIPQGNVCGEGMHHHEPHLTVVLSDAKVQITSEDGKSQDVEVPSGASIWFEAETHSVINRGNEPTKMILVFLKE